MEPEDLAKRIRNAGMQALCSEGRWEAAISALKTVELAPLLRKLKQQSAD